MSRNIVYYASRPSGLFRVLPSFLIVRPSICRPNGNISIKYGDKMRGEEGGGLKWWKTRLREREERFRRVEIFEAVVFPRGVNCSNSVVCLLRGVARGGSERGCFEWLSSGDDPWRWSRGVFYGRAGKEWEIYDLLFRREGTRVSSKVKFPSFERVKKFLSRILSRVDGLRARKLSGISIYEILKF